MLACLLSVSLHAVEDYSYLIDLAGSASDIEIPGVVEFDPAQTDLAKFVSELLNGTVSAAGVGEIARLAERTAGI